MRARSQKGVADVSAQTNSDHGSWGETLPRNNRRGWAAEQVQELSSSCSCSCCSSSSSQAWAVQEKNRECEDGQGHVSSPAVG